MKTLALSLRGGMFKCFSYLGLFKVLEENNIKVDTIMATSGGALVGGLYANGLSIDEILAFAKEFSFKNYVTFNSIRNLCVADSDKMTNTLQRILKSDNFSDSKIKFIVSSTSLQTTKPAFLQEGSVSKAIAAGCSYPFFVTPVKIDGNFYSDGAFSSGYNTSYLKSLGNDIVIGSSIGGHNVIRPAETKLFIRFAEHVRMLTQNLEELEQKIDPVDLLIEGMAVGFKRTDIKSADAIFQKGYAVSSKYIEAIKELLKN